MNFYNRPKNFSEFSGLNEENKSQKKQFAKAESSPQKNGISSNSLSEIRRKNPSKSIVVHINENSQDINSNFYRKH